MFTPGMTGEPKGITSEVHTLILGRHITGVAAFR
jgi:hypothetical protein